MISWCRWSKLTYRAWRLALQAQQRAADSSVAQQTLVQQLVQQSNLLKQRIELICSHALKRQQLKQELEQQQQQQQDAELEAEMQNLQEQREEQQQQEQEQIRLTMSGARNLADQLLALLDKQQLSASGAAGAGVAAGHVAVAGDAAAATWQQQLKQQLEDSSSRLLVGAAADSSAGGQQKLHALLDAQAVIQGLLPQRNTSSGGGSFLIGTSLSGEHRSADGDRSASSEGQQGPSASGGLSRLGHPAAASQPCELDLEFSSPEDAAARSVESRGSQQGTAGAGDEQQQQQELPIQQHQQHRGLQAGSAPSSLESDFARRSTPVGAVGLSRGSGLSAGRFEESPLCGEESPSPEGRMPHACNGADASGGVTWYYSALGGEEGWDTSPGGYEEEQHGSASAAAAAAQAAKAASAAAVRASSHLLCPLLASHPESPDGETLGSEGQQIQVYQGLRDGDMDLVDAFTTPEVAAAAELAAGSSSALRQRWNSWRQRYQQTAQQQEGRQARGPDDEAGDDQDDSDGVALQMPRWAGQPVWAVAGVSGYR